MRSKDTGERRRRAPAGNRALLVAGLGAAFAAVLSLGLLQATAGSASTTDTAAGAAQAPAAAAAEAPAGGSRRCRPPGRHHGQQVRRREAAGRQGRRDRPVDQPRHGPAHRHHHQGPEEVRLGHPGEGRLLVVHLHHGGHVRVLLRGAPGHGGVREGRRGRQRVHGWVHRRVHRRYVRRLHGRLLRRYVGGSTGGSGSGGTSGGDTGGTSGGSSGGTSGGSTGGSTGGGTGGGDGGDEQCASVQDVLLPILQHLNAAHLERSPGEQVQDALALDSYIKMHTVWVESILTPATEGGGAAVDDTLGVLLQHVNSAHLEESLGQQITDLLDVDSYVKMHTVWAEHMLAPTTGYLTSSC